MSNIIYTILYYIPPHILTNLYIRWNDFKYVSICRNQVQICLNMSQPGSNQVQICLNMSQPGSRMSQYVSTRFTYVSIGSNMSQYVSICFNQVDAHQYYYDLTTLPPAKSKDSGTSSTKLFWCCIRSILTIV